MSGDSPAPGAEGSLPSAAPPEADAAGAAPAPAAGPPVLELRGVQVRFGRQRVLRDLDLTVRKGETLAVIGESGCGKTVLLKLLVGLLEPTAGQALFDGRELRKLAGRALVKQRLRFGFVFQQAALFDSMDVFENVAFALRAHRRMPEPRLQGLVRDRLLEVGLQPEIVGKMPAELSGGMRKRVGLARALALEPEVMLYDEPTTGLDPIMSDVINELILRARRSRPVTSVVVTHDMSSARKVADRVVMLHPLARLAPDEPQVLYDGPPGGLDSCPDERVRQFVRGEAGDRLRELLLDGGDSGEPEDQPRGGQPRGGPPGGDPPGGGTGRRATPW